MAAPVEMSIAPFAIVPTPIITPAAGGAHKDAIAVPVVMALLVTPVACPTFCFSAKSIWDLARIPAPSASGSPLGAVLGVVLPLEALLTCVAMDLSPLKLVSRMTPLSSALLAKGSHLVGPASLNLPK